MLWVRVAVGGLPARDSIGALLHREEIPDRSLTQGNERFAVVALNGWEEPQLRNATAQFTVYRNKLDRTGATVAMSFPAILVQFDAATRIGILSYCDDFEYSADPGFHLQHGGTLSNVTTLRVSHGTWMSGPTPRRTAREQAFTVEAASYPSERSAHPSGNVSAPDLTRVVNPARLLLSEPDTLVGFVEYTQNNSTLTRLDHFSAAISLPVPQLIKATFAATPEQARYQIDLALEPSAGDFSVKHLRLHIRDGSPSALASLPPPSASGVFAPITEQSIELPRSSGSPDTWTASLPNPVAGQQQFCLLQLSWPMFPQARTPELYGKPFLIKVERRPTGLYPEVVGLPVDAAVSASEKTSGVQPAPVVEMQLEAAAQEVHLIAGGREALIHLSAAPFWKRFSFERNAWLPLPGNMANVSVTGDLDALFVLDRDTQEIRKFRLPGLELGGVRKLPPDDYLTALAGCNSGHAPLQIITATEAMSLDSETLQRRDAAWWTNAGQKPPIIVTGEPSTAGVRQTYFNSGDGLCVWRLGRYNQPYLYYNSDLRGLDFGYLGQSSNIGYGVPGVTGGFYLENGLRSRDTLGGKADEAGRPAAPWTAAPSALSENAPVIFRLLRPTPREMPPHPPRLGCFTFSGGLPFAEVDVPELAGLSNDESWPKDRWAFLDPYSQQLATLSADRKTWVVRKLILDENLGQPLLLNWPDTTVARGQSFRFEPRLAGGTEFTAELLGQSVHPAVNGRAGTVEFPISSNEFDAVKLLNFTVPGKDAAQVSYPIIVHVAGPPLPFVTPPLGSVDGLNEQGTGLASLGLSHEGLLPLAAELYEFTDPIREMYGPVAGCAVLLTASNRLDFFSLQTRRVVGAGVGAAKAAYYPAADGILEYDPAKRTLTRIGIPSGVRERVLALPPNVNIRGIGAGTDRGSPVTLAVETNQDQRSMRFGDLTITQTSFHDAAVVLDGLTLQAGTHVQPQNLEQFLGKRGANPDPFNGILGDLGPNPITLPTSRNGFLIWLPQRLLALGPNYGVAYPFAEGASRIALDHAFPGLPRGSKSGLMAFAGLYEAYRGGDHVGASDGYNELGATPDGLYQLRQVTTQRMEAVLEIRPAGDDKPLLRVARLAFSESGQTPDNTRATMRVQMLGDSGPLAVLSRSGRTLELTDLDVSVVMKSVAPDEFHVVSQPVPVIMEGATMQYQVRLNNPEAAQFCRLRSSIPDASISPTGLLSYTAPSSISGPTHVVVSIEVVGKKGQVVSQTFPIFVLPKPRPGFKSKVGEI